REIAGYTGGSWPIFPLGFLYSVQAGMGFALGALCYAVFAAYAHELQHQYPECCFWLRRPVHHLHHAEKMWHHNFGITFDIWDRVFGTYRPSDYQPPARRAWGNLFRVKWVASAVAGSQDL
ncbi:MAG TPA: sterol desaturase family protein, partial [Polyangiaceae bacterium]|nr:sterol desaturase family protein [Polyangiaceae bacterium]